MQSDPAKYTNTVVIPHDANYVTLTKSGIKTDYDILVRLEDGGKVQFALDNDLINNSLYTITFAVIVTDSNHVITSI